MFVTFATLVYSGGEASVTFYPADTKTPVKTVKATREVMVHNPDDKIKRFTYIYRATMQPLQPHTKYGQ